MELAKEPWKAHRFTSLKAALAEARKRKCLVWVNADAAWNEASQLWKAQSAADNRLALLRDKFVFLEFDVAAQPELDQSIQFLLQKLSQRSGWPSQLFLDGEGRPVVGVPPLEVNDLRGLVFDLANAWSIDPVELSRQAELARTQVHAADPLACDFKRPSDFPDREIAEMSFLTPLEQSLDFETGFVGRSSEVYLYPSVYKCLLARPDWSKWAELALTNLSRSHLCDVLEGGFYRSAHRSPEEAVCTEKLLSENAELLDALVSVQASSRTEFLRKTASEIVRLILNAFAIKGAGIGFGASLAADENYYRLVPADLLKALPGPQRQPAQMFFGVESGGRVPYLPTELPILSSFLNIPPVDLSRGLGDAAEKLARFRVERSQGRSLRLGARARYPEALAVRALFQAARLNSLVSESEVRERLHPILNDWQKNKLELTAREYWATANAWLAAARWGLEHDRAWGMECLREADGFLSSAAAPSSVVTDIPFLGARWDLSDHLGPSAAALRLKTLVDRFEVANKEGDRASATQLMTRLEGDCELLLPVCRSLGLHAAGFYESFVRYNLLKLKN